MCMHDGVWLQSNPLHTLLLWLHGIREWSMAPSVTMKDQVRGIPLIHYDSQLQAIQ